MKSRRNARAVWASVLIVYFLLSIFGMWLAVYLDHAAALWPASGVAVAAVVLFGSRAAVAIFLGSLLANLAEFFVFRHLSLSQGLFPAFALAAANAVVPWLSAEWMRRFCGGGLAFRNWGYFLRFIAVAAIGLPMLGVAVCVGSEALTGLLPVAKLGGAWLKWWLGDCVGVLVFAPLVLIWAGFKFARFRGGQILEAAVLMILLALASNALASFAMRGANMGSLGAFLVIPILLWIGFRMRGPGATAALLVLTTIATAGAVHGWATYPGSSAGESLIYLQSFFAIAAVAGLGFVAALDERDDNLEKLHHFNEDLERKVAARTRQLEQINQELTDAVSIVAHDVRGPVSGIRTLARHMRWAGLDLSAAEGNELLGEIERTSAEAVEMMGRLLDLQRANHRAIGLTPTDVGRLVADMCRHYEIAAQEKGVVLRVSRPGRDMAHLVDTDGIKFIISNLVSNALKFLPTGGMVEVRVSEGFSGCMLVVSDNGPGIAERELPGLFNRFAKAANRPTAGESSSGLGLFIVRKLVLSMKGTLYVESVPGAGAMFVVEWPAEAIRTEKNVAWKETGEARNP